MNFPRIIKQDNWRLNLTRGLVGQPAESKNEAMLHDTMDLIPLIGDVPNLIRIATNKGNRYNQATDFFVGVIPVVGDVADFFLTSDTNLKAFEKRPGEMGRVETIGTGKFIANAIERYVGGNQEREIFTDR